MNLPLQSSTIFPALLWVLSMTLPGVFKSDKLPLWTNGVIAIGSIALLSFLSALSNGLFTNNFQANWAAYFAVFSASLATAKPLDDWLTQNFDLPFLHPVQKPPSTP